MGGHGKGIAGAALEDLAKMLVLLVLCLIKVRLLLLVDNLLLHAGFGELRGPHFITHIRLKLCLRLRLCHRLGPDAGSTALFPHALLDHSEDITTLLIRHIP